MRATAARLAEFVRGWRSLGGNASDGDVMCAGCWDRADHDNEADTEIPAGHPVFWSIPHPEYGDCDAYCIACVIDDATNNEIVSEAVAHQLGIEWEAERYADPRLPRP